MQADPEVLGVLYTGSLGRGATDPFSDLDLDVWVTAEAFSQVDAKLQEVLSRLGAIQFSYPRGPAFVTALVGPDWQRVDLHLHGPAERQSFAEYSGARVIKDTNGMLAEIVERAPTLDDAPSWESARAVIEEAIDSLMYLSLHNARGEHWSAAAEITGVAIPSLYTVLAGFRGRDSHGLRYLASTLTGEEQTMLARAWPATVERGEVRRAGRALWDWVRYVWREVERMLDHPLEINLDGEALLVAIDRLYTMPPGPSESYPIGMSDTDGAE